jgi:type VI secretion system protein ImpI
MILMLEITGSQAEKLGASRRKVFNAAGGTIGRLPDNQWALPDPYISSRHALIKYVNGVFYIEDTSTNGVFVNSQNNRLVKGQPYALKSGDWIFIEPYEIKASISEQKEPAESLLESPLLAPPVSGRVPSYSIPDDPFASSPSLSRPSGPSVRPDPDEGLATADGEVDPLRLLGLEGRREEKRVPNAPELARKPVISEHYTPPKPIVAPQEPVSEPPVPPIPDDYNPLVPDDRPVVSPSPPSPPVALRGDSRVSRAQPSRPVRPKEVPQTSDDVSMRAGAVDLKAVLLGAGLENVAVTPELARNFGEILRVVVGGVMDVLQARQTLKNEFRLGVTTFKPADNNPLKFSANVDDALHNLLVKRNAAYLGPVDAFEDAFEDVRNHQMAMLAGMRVAFEAMLAEFTPERLQEEFDRRSKKSALLSTPAKFRYWELYREKFHDMVRDSERCFRELFGEEFAEAYEEQLKHLKTHGRVPKR